MKKREFARLHVHSVIFFLLNTIIADDVFYAASVIVAKSTSMGQLYDERRGNVVHPYETTDP